MEKNNELGPTYKSLFLAACGIIGGCFGWWLTHFVSTFERLQRDVSAMEAELRKDNTKLEARIAELEWRVNQHDRAKPNHNSWPK